MDGGLVRVCLAKDGDELKIKRASLIWYRNSLR